jgi:hypothetical protein
MMRRDAVHDGIVQLINHLNARNCGAGSASAALRCSDKSPRQWQRAEIRALAADDTAPVLMRIGLAAADTARRSLRPV